MVKGFFGKIFGAIKFFGEKVATAVNYILLTIVYVLGISVTWLIAKVLRKRFLELKPSRYKKSYWSDVEQVDYTKKENYRSF